MRRVFVEEAPVPSKKKICESTWAFDFGVPAWVLVPASEGDWIRSEEVQGKSKQSPGNCSREIGGRAVFCSGIFFFILLRACSLARCIERGTSES